MKTPFKGAFRFRLTEYYYIERISNRDSVEFGTHPYTRRFAYTNESGTHYRSPNMLFYFPTRINLEDLRTIGVNVYPTEEFSLSAIPDRPILFVLNGQVDNQNLDEHGLPQLQIVTGRSLRVAPYGISLYDMIHALPERSFFISNTDGNYHIGQYILDNNIPIGFFVHSYSREMHAQTIEEKIS